MSAAPAVTIGVLALQGAFHEHAVSLRKAAEALASKGEPGAVQVVEVRTKDDLDQTDGLVLPGGESTTMGLIAQRSGFLPSLSDYVKRDERPIFATCAGLIMLAKSAEHTKEGGQPLLGGLDVCVDRNYFGAQLMSFETTLDVAVDGLPEESCEAVFIRAPVVTKVEEGVKVVATLPKERSPKPDEKEERIVAVQQGHILATAFHPELTPDTLWHELFIRQVRTAKAKSS